MHGSTTGAETDGRMADATERFQAAARERDLDVEVRRWPEGTRTAADAARAVGCDVAQIVKSLVFMAGDEPVVALTSGSNRVDTGKLAEIVGAPDARQATPDEAREATGFSIGGTPPFGHTGPVRVLIDPDLFEFDEVWAAAGAPDATFAVDPHALQRAAAADEADFTEGRPKS